MSVSRLLIESTTGLRLIKTNARLRSEELDLVVVNERTDGYWRYAGSPVVIECKHWSKPVGAKDIRDLVGKMMAISPETRTGVLVAPRGITGQDRRDAELVIRESRQRGRNVIPLELADLERAAAGEDFARLVDQKYNDVVVMI